jgi:hypothetical protein
MAVTKYKRIDGKYYDIDGNEYFPRMSILDAFAITQKWVKYTPEQMIEARELIREANSHNRPTHK